ncbi:MAG TPA: DUF2470 domain-containing protein [Pseudonocardiaceae bacterium]|nr:DUF2470 domain-containing protein [Pseudonocardiaceae bacterium]
MTDGRRPPVPVPASRARTIAARGGQAALLRSADPAIEPTGHPAVSGEKIEPHLHHVHADGAVTLLLADDHPLVGAAGQAPRGELAAMVEIADRAAVVLREPVRGLLWITGWLRLLSPAEGRAAAVTVAETQPDSRLLDVGHGMAVLRLVAASMVLADGEGSSSLGPAEFAAARPDPFCRYEDHWLRHLDLSHRDVVGMLTRLLPESLRGGHVRPLGLDRFGLRLRVETSQDDHDVRLAFSQPVDTPQGLAVELRRMVGCPFLAQAKTA